MGARPAPQTTIKVSLLPNPEHMNRSSMEGHVATANSDQARKVGVILAETRVAPYGQAVFGRARRRQRDVAKSAHARS